MAAEAFIQCRVPQATKAALRAAAQRQQITESALLKRMLQLVLYSADPVGDGGAADAADRAARQARLYVRLTPDDRLLLQARSAARYLAPATYASVLLRAHLRALTPVPEAELRAFRQATRELAAIGRNLNQVARATHHGGAGMGASRENLLAMIKICEAMRDHFRAYVSTNLSSWESGNAAP